jgi:NAD(P)-dependent dehydrogenase (short-subunit alcohol dehydrogenase family)
MAASSTPVWLVVGASSGFGKAIAYEALKRSHHVIAAARSASALSSLKDAGAHVMELDVTWDELKMQTAIDAAVAQYGRITHVVNAAGYILEGCVEESSAKDVFGIFNTNVFGIVNVIRAVSSHLRVQHSGVIANFGSIGSWSGGAGAGFYASTKWAVSGLSESLTAELKPFGIDVCVIEPGYFRTEFLNAGRRLSTTKRISAYEESAAGQTRQALDQFNNNQPGDVSKGAKVIVDVLTKSGASEGREIPLRLVLGDDAQAIVREKCQSTLELLKEWEGVTTHTSHEQ